MNINELSQEVRDWALAYFLDNEVGSDEYRDTQPGNGLNIAAGFNFGSMTAGLNPSDLEMIEAIRNWMDAIIEESKGVISTSTDHGYSLASNMYPGVDALEPVLRLSFNSQWDAGINPAPSYWETADDILAAYDEDKSS